MEHVDSNTGPGHARLLRCTMLNRAGKSSIRYVELEQYRLWAYMMESRHGFTVQDLQLSLWVNSSEFRDKTDLFLHCGNVEEVSRIAFCWFNPRHHYTLDVARYVPSEQYESVKQILLSHVSESSREAQAFRLDEQHGFCVNQAVDDPGLELILGISDAGFQADATATA
ncbi:MAG: hypothetical protein R3225_01700 [Halofilum sp. (in: g-proteobacteria)]|nr:hypothetical protein [Halofilum sp. (in: g-proteobacteria)]